MTSSVPQLKATRLLLWAIWRNLYLAASLHTLLSLVGLIPEEKIVYAYIITGYLGLEVHNVNLYLYFL